LRAQERLRLALRDRTDIAALYYSLLESAKLADVEPKLYLLTATRAALADPKVVTLPRDPGRNGLESLQSARRGLTLLLPSNRSFVPLPDFLCFLTLPEEPGNR
jgi:hypothetical protein